MTGALLIDANLLCLLVVGATSRAAIGQHRRLRSYDQNDYELVVAVVERFPSVIVCPHVLTETSNLLRYTNDAFAGRLQGALGAFALRSVERWEPVRKLIDDEAFVRLGLADAMLLWLADTGDALFSDDRDLCRAAGERGLRTVNFNYLRSGAIRLDQLT